MFDDDYSEISLLPINKSYWKPNDKEWVEDREGYWKKVIKKRASNLLVKNFSGLYVKEDLNDLKDYFVNGNVAPYETMILFVLLWLHPSSKKEVWVDLKKSSDHLSYNFIHSYFYKTSFKILFTAIEHNSILPERYWTEGFVGDRLGLLYNILVNDNSSKWDKDEKIHAIKQEYINMPKSRYVGQIVGSHSDRLNKNAIGQFFIDEWLDKLEIYITDKDEKESVQDIFIRIILKNSYLELPISDYSKIKEDIFSPILTILIFDPKNHDTLLQNRVSKELYDRIEGNASLPSSVLKLWGETKLLIEDCVRNKKKYIK